MALSSLAGRGLAAAATRSVGGTAANSVSTVAAQAGPAAATIIVIPAVEE
jgi:hypothetical protein